MEPSRKGDCKMKKFLALTCMIACLFGLTACESEEPLTKFEKYKLNEAIIQTQLRLIPTIQNVLQYETVVAEMHEYTPEEVAKVVADGSGLSVDGRAFMSALDSFAATYEEIGGTGQITGSEAVIDGDQIIVNVYIKGPEQDAEAEVVYSNDTFLKLEAASLNKVSTMSDSMAKAGLNTLLGMGTVFTVLILISIIISCFGIIPKIQAKMAKKESGAVQTTGINNAVTQIAKQEEVTDATDDLELVAVIAAAIAASEGSASTDGFVVRSIKRRRAY